ncbi:MAG TPA: hypothetical protein DD384_05180 [Firmicutes bacterium]|nr:hypothetical protein [Bacillota bacterium]
MEKTRKTNMKNILLVLSSIFLLAGCQEENRSSSNKEENSQSQIGDSSNENSQQASESSSETKKALIKINEVESKDANGGNDWVEIINIGDTEADLSGYFLTDDKGLERFDEKKTTPLAEGTKLGAGKVMVLEDTINFDFGLGKQDTATLYDSNKEIVDSYSYTSEAAGDYSRLPDGTGEFADRTPSKGILNKDAKEEEPITEEKSVKINEINSSPDDWVELYNPSEKEMDLSGYEIRDNSDDHRFKIKNGTKIGAKSFFVLEENLEGEIYDDVNKKYVTGLFKDALGLGGGDSCRLFDKEGKLIDSYSWNSHASYEGDASKASYGRYPDGDGNFTLTKESKGFANVWYKPNIVINEVESKDPNGGGDYVEIMNLGTTDVDISGWYLLDDDPIGHKAETTPLKSGSIIKAGSFFVFEGDKDFTFGLGKADKASVYSSSGIEVASYEWSTEASGVYARMPDGTGDFQDVAEQSKGRSNLVRNPAVINEVESNAPDNGPDWVELANPTNEKIDVSGLILKDSKDDKPYTIKEGTFIEANGFLLINDLTFGLGKDDSVRLFDGDLLIDSTTYSGHTSPSWGRYPDANGKEFRNTLEMTPGKRNRFEGIPDLIDWPGEGEVSTFDKQPTFLEDSSGLDFANGKLYAVDNGTATFWELDVNKDGNIRFADGFEKGKKVRFQKDKDNPNAKGPDAEGITVDSNGMVYLASERDNSSKGVNYNTILMVDSSKEGTELIAQKEWDLTSLLPSVSANMGVESVEFVEAGDVSFLDKNTNSLFSMDNYPQSVANGVFFVALEDNGHVYAFVLNKDGSAILLSDIDSKLGGAMALDFDTSEKTLWVAADNGYGNRSAKIKLNGTDNPEITHLLPPSGLDMNGNFEGFAIADISYVKNGERPVYRFQDGVKEGALSIGSISVKE